MRFDIGHKDKTYHYELETESINGKKLGEKFKGEELSPDFAGYEFEITGASDMSGFPAKADLEGTGRKAILLKKGFGMKKKGKGLIKRKTLRGNTIAADIAQVNLKVVKEGSKGIAAILGKEEKPTEEKPAEAPKEEKKEEAKPKEKAEEKKE